MDRRKSRESCRGLVRRRVLFYFSAAEKRGMERLARSKQITQQALVRELIGEGTLAELERLGRGESSQLSVVSDQSE